jgi:tetratricopeptide (TPR) repeat protein
VKWARRRPALAGLLVVSALAALSLTSGGILFTRQVQDERDKAEAQRANAVREKEEADLARADALDNYALARQAVDQYSRRVSDDLMLRQEDLRPLRKQLLETALPFYEKLVRKHADDLAVRAERAAAYERLGLLTKEIGDQERALAHFQQAQTLFTQLAEAQPQESKHQESLANLCNELGGLHLALARTEQAEICFKDGIRRWQELLQREPTNFAFRTNVNSLQNNLALLYLEQQRVAEAEKLFQQSLSGSAELVRESPEEPAPRFSLAKSHLNMGNLHRSTGRLPQALSAYEKAAAIQEQLVRDHPRVAEYEQALVKSYSNLGGLFGQMDQLGRARQVLQKAIEHGETLVQRNPSVIEFALDLAGACNNLGGTCDKKTERKEAAAAYRRALEIQERLARDHPQLEDLNVALAGSYCNMGLHHLDDARPQEALTWLTRAAALLETAQKRNARQITVREFLRNTYYGQGTALAQLERDAEASRAWEQAVALADGPVRDFLAVQLGGSYCNAGNQLVSQHNTRDALSWYDKAIKTLGELVQGQAGGPQARQFLANSYIGRASARYALERYAQALPDFEQALKLTGGSDPQWRLGRASTRARLGDHEQATREAAEIVAVKGLSPGVRYDVACVYAVSAGAAKDAAQADAYAGRAIELLRQTAASGFFSDKARREHLRQDPDLHALRSRPAFQQLLKELESGVANSTP